MKIKSFKDVQEFLTKTQKYYASRGRENHTLSFAGPDMHQLRIDYYAGPGANDFTVAVVEYHNGRQCGYSRSIVTMNGIIPTPETVRKGNREYTRQAYSTIFKYRKMLEAFTDNIGIK